VVSALLTTAGGFQLPLAALSSLTQATILSGSVKCMATSKQLVIGAENCVENFLKSLVAIDPDSEVEMSSAFVFSRPINTCSESSCSVDDVQCDEIDYVFIVDNSVPIT